MKIGRGRTHYWDTCVFLHWLSDPVKDKSVIDAIEDIVRASERGDVTIFTSAITRIEVLRGHLTQDAADKFVSLFPRSVEWVNVTPAVAHLAHDIRDYYHERKPQKKLKTPDCIHLASAIANGADEMNTLDKPDLLSLNEYVMGGKYKMRIVKPIIVLPPLLQPMAPAPSSNVVPLAPPIPPSPQAEAPPAGPLPPPPPVTPKTSK